MRSDKLNSIGPESPSSVTWPPCTSEPPVGDRFALLLRLRYALGSEEPTPYPVRHPLFERLRMALGATQCLHYRYRTGHAVLELHTVLGSPKARRIAAPCPDVDGSMFGSVVNRRGPLVVTDLQHSAWADDAATKQLGLQRAVAMRLLVDGATAGVLAFTWATLRDLEPRDLLLLRLVAREVAWNVARHDQLVVIREREARIERADRAQEDYMAMVAHELRNPLAPIRHAAHLLRKAAAADPTLVRCADIIQRQVAQMVRLVDDLQDFRRLPDERMALQCDRLDLRAAVSRAVEATAPLIAERQHRLSVEQPKQPVLVLGDLDRLTQVFCNLLGNATKYTPPGGQIALTVRHVGEHVEILIQDNGIGLDPEQFHQVFEMFVRVPRPHEPGFEGHGIGLALVRTLVQRHGGEVSATSEGAGRGSCFVVRLPSLP